MNEEYKELPIYISKNTKIIGYLKCDPEDYEMLKNYNININFKGIPCIYIKSKRYLVHKLIMNPPDNLVVDHLEHDLFDVRKSKLRIVTQHINTGNRKGLGPQNTSGYRNVHPMKSGRWAVSIGHKGKEIFCGAYDDIKDAAQAAANKRAELGYLDNGKIPEIISVEHKRYIPKRNSYPGINWNKNIGKWHARVNYQKHRYHCGFFPNLEEAIQAVEIKKKELGIS